jgi:hypothetical protein
MKAEKTKRRKKQPRTTASFIWFTSSTFRAQRFDSAALGRPLKETKPLGTNTPTLLPPFWHRNPLVVTVVQTRARTRNSPAGHAHGTTRQRITTAAAAAAATAMATHFRNRESRTAVAAAVVVVAVAEVGVGACLSSTRRRRRLRRHRRQQNCQGRWAPHSNQTEGDATVKGVGVVRRQMTPLTRCFKQGDGEWW